MKYLKRSEELVYMAIWFMAWVFPIATSTLHAGYGHATAHQVMWPEVFFVWRFLATFFVCFLVHNLFIAPQLVYRNHRVAYLLQALGALMIFFAVHCVMGSEARHRFRQGERPRMERVEGPQSFQGHDGLPHAVNADGGHSPRFAHRPPHRPIPDFGLPHRGELFSLLVMVLLFGLNIGMKYFFKSDEESKRISDLERKNLEQQVEYLKYQINPHFFMNTLNNIHALIDINPEQAKYTVLVLSRMMRYVLYEGERPLIPLRKEVDFIQNYVELMRIRYTQHVNIRFHVEPDLPEAIVPPLLFITFVENAFKHGVSGGTESFIHIEVGSDEEQQRICLDCANSVHPTSSASASQDAQGGVGIKNAVGRMQLIYGSQYTYVVDANADSYVVHLEVPTHPSEQIAR